MKRIAVFGYGIIGFLLFHTSLLYFIGFIANLSFLPKTIDSGEAGAPLPALLLNSVFIVLFGLQHSIMARPKFKRWWANFLSEAIERTSYVVLASLLILMLSWHWQPLPTVVWRVTAPAGYWLLFGLFWCGWIFAMFASGLIDLFDLIGLCQVYAYWKDLYPVTGQGRYVFPSARTADRPMSDNAILSAMRRMGIEKEEMSGHGFRAMARTILDEVLGFRPDFIEHQLAHAVKDPNGRAYNRTAHLPERRAMMQSWADYLDKLRAGAEMIPFRKAA
ncbi:methanethiol S-methyltransferase [Gammaproteobacteria bacterium]